MSTTYNNIILLKSDGSTLGFENVQTAVNSASSGDLVSIYPGTYDGGIVLKNNVDLFLLPNAIISSSELTGTLRDNGNQINIVIEGRGDIYNISGSSYEIVLTHPSSSIEKTLRANSLNNGDFLRVELVSGSLNFVNKSTHELKSLILDSKIIYVSTSDDLSAKVALATSSQLIDVGPGTHNLGSNQVILKNDVNFKFSPGVIISSSHPSGTFSDDNQTVITYWNGEPIIYNSNGAANFWVIASNANSKIIGYERKYIAQIQQSGSNNPSVLYLHKNSLGSDVSWSRTATGSYLATSSVATLNGIVYVKSFVGYNNDGKLFFGYGQKGSLSKQLKIFTYDISGSAIDINSTNPVNIEVNVYYTLQ